VKTIEFLRHAESSANAGLATSDPGEIPLTKAGWDAAEAAARDCKGRIPDLIIVSPFRRAQETAEPFKKRFPNAAIEEWPVQEFTYLSPARCFATTSNDRLPLVEVYWKGATAEHIDGPGAESFQQFLERVQFALKKLRCRNEQAILVISHEMFIKAAMWLETPGVESPTPQSFRGFALGFAIPNLGRWSCPMTRSAI
jgi:broad specificity phosphatase PhoE